MTKKNNLLIQTSGKRKTAVARAVLKKGKGRVLINNTTIELFKPAFYALRIKEPMILADKVANEVDISVRVSGGGFSSQADAIRIAISKALVEHSPSLKQLFLDYDRAMLVSDVRFKEVSKPNSQGQARSKRQKSYR
jgi:small subunit ribosomal protein S9